MVRAAVIVLGAGSGSRLGADRNKVLLPLAGLPVIAWSVRTVLSLTDVKHVVVTHHPAEEWQMRQALLPVVEQAEIRLVAGGATRHESEWLALQAVRPEILRGELDVVAIHDGARPFASPTLFKQVIGAASQYGAALPAIDLPGLVDAETLAEQTGAMAVQTPQAFTASELLNAYATAAYDQFSGTDTAATVEQYTKLWIRGVPGETTNLKLTWPGDVQAAERLLAETRQLHRFLRDTPGAYVRNEANVSSVSSGPSRGS